MRPLFLLSLLLFACNGGDQDNKNKNKNKDTDGDGVPDTEDVCPDADDRIDADGDGLPDACDPCRLDPTGSDDVDGDGVCNRFDRCPGADDAEDVDGDGVCDAIDRCPTDPLPNEDNDNDGVCNSDDACADYDDGIDGDGDGQPNACDPCPYDAFDDSDGDNHCDSDDLCPGFDDNADIDGDGQPDDCDPCPLDSPNDTDGDLVCDSDDPCPIDNPDDSDGDTVCDSDDLCPLGDDTIDDDGDGWIDACDPCPGDQYNSCITPGQHLSEWFFPTDAQGQYCYGSADVHYAYFGELPFEECENKANATGTQWFVGISAPYVTGWIGSHNETQATTSNPASWTTELIVDKTQLRSCVLGEFEHRTEASNFPIEQIYFDATSGRTWHFWDLQNQTHSQAISFGDNRGARIINPSSVGQPTTARMTAPTHWCHAGAQFNGNNNCNSDQSCDFFVGYFE